MGAVKNKVYLIDLGTGTDRNLLPLSIGLIASYSLAQEKLRDSYDIEILFLREEPAVTVEKMESPVIVAFAAYVWNLKASVNLARVIKRKYPKALIIFGGYSVPKDLNRVEDFFLDNAFLDIVVHGEGEVTFSCILDALLNGVGLDSVSGISYRSNINDREVITTYSRDRIRNLDLIPSPFLNGVFDVLMEKYGSKVTGVIWETNRGCPYSCTFCDWGNADVNKVMKYGVERLKQELEWISRNKIYYIYGADANFGIFYERDFDLAKTIANLHRQYGYPGYLMINWLKNSHERIVAIAAELTGAGVLTNITLALQSLNKDTLALIKRKNISQGSMFLLKKEFHDRELPTYIELILGLPGETFDTFVDGINSILTTRLDDHFVIYPCTLLENTEMARVEYRVEHGLITRRCKIGMSRREFEFDSEEEEILVGTNSMPIDDWMKSYLLGYVITALYNHRLAFFPMCFIQHQFGVKQTDIANFLLSSVFNNLDEYPSMANGFGHIVRQSELILAGKNYMSSPRELDNIVLTPHEACAALLLGDADRFYSELGQVIKCYLNTHNFYLNDVYINDVVLYQKCVIPKWPNSNHDVFEFRSNIPALMKEMVDGEIQSKIAMLPHRLNVLSKSDPCLAYHKFAASLIRAGHTLSLLDHSVEAMA